MKEADEGEPDAANDKTVDKSLAEADTKIEIETIPEDPEARRERLLNLPTRGILVSAGFR